MPRTELRATRDADDDRWYAEQLWAAAARGDRDGFDRIFDDWLTRCYQTAWRSSRHRALAQIRVRAQMLRAVGACAPPVAPAAPAAPAAATTRSAR